MYEKKKTRVVHNAHISQSGTAARNPTTAFCNIRRRENKFAKRESAIRGTMLFVWLSSGPPNRPEFARFAHIRTVLFVVLCAPLRSGKRSAFVDLYIWMVVTPNCVCLVRERPEKSEEFVKKCSFINREDAKKNIQSDGHVCLVMGQGRTL